MVIKGRTHEELWQFIIQNSLTELVKWGILTSQNKKLKTKNYCNRDKSDFKSG